MKKILYRLFDHENLGREESRHVMLRIANGEFNASQIAAFITVFLMRSITLEELSGFRDALLELRTPVDLSGYDAVDIVGTGGDGKNTFNISTAACFVVARAGYKVVKHGNYGSTSISGASNVMEYYGVRFTSDQKRLQRSLEGCNVAYLHAPLFNAAMKAVAPVRKDLAVRTFFNMLGPLVNPAIPRRQLLGVYNLKLARLYHYLNQQSGTSFTIVNSLDGYDEISLTSGFKYFTNHSEGILYPEDIGFGTAREAELYGGETIGQAADIFGKVLDGTASPAQINAVVANAAFAISTFDDSENLSDCLQKAERSLLSGNAKKCFVKFLSLNL